MWTLPLLTTVGAVIVIGPIIARVRCRNLHDRLCKHLGSVTSTDRPGSIKGAAG